MLQLKTVIVLIIILLTMFNRNPKPWRFAECKAKVINPANGQLEPDVVPHLAYDPSDVAALAEQGRSITTHNVEGMYYDGETGLNCEVSFDRLRGVDLNDVWCESQKSKEKLSKAKVRSVDLATVNS